MRPVVIPRCEVTGTDCSCAGDCDMPGSKDTNIPYAKTTSNGSAATGGQVTHEVEALRQLVFTRLDAMDKAIFLFNDNITRVPTETDRQIDHLKTLIDEKFRSIATQFAERDTRTEQTSRDSKVAVDAALQAAKEAVGEQNKSSALAISKSESATTKQIDQQSTLIATATASLSDKLDDLKSRLLGVEGRATGVTAPDALSA